MKKSNLFILSSALLIWGFFVGTNTLLGKYVSVSEFQNNQRESVKSLDTETYNYKTVYFDEPFDEIIIRDTSENLQTYPVTGTTKEIQWIKSKKSGLKKIYRDDFIRHMKVEQNKLIISIASKPQFSGTKIIVYSPTLNKINFENAGSTSLIDTKSDSLAIESNFSDVEVAESTLLKKLKVQANEKATVTVKAKFIDQVDYLLSSNSTIRSQIDTCNRLYIQGGSSLTVFISLIFSERKCPYILYNYITYNDSIGTVVIENTTVNKVKGNKDKLTLYMTVKQIEETLRNVSSE